MKIALDAKAGDLGLEPNLAGAVKAARSGTQVLLVGPEREIREHLEGLEPGALGRFEIVDAPDVIKMGEDPAAACRSRPGCSIMRCAEAVAQGRAQAMVSAGHSGATMVAALWHLKRIRGIHRPAIAAALPTARGRTLLLDAGANVDCDPVHLVQFGTMGALYAREVFAVERPTVGLLSIGEEEGKGDSLVRAAAPLLRSGSAPFKFHGPIEGRDIPRGVVDVVVCDGFVGNIVLKAMEGLAKEIFRALKEEVSKAPHYRLGALFMKGAFRSLKNRLSDEEYGGAPLLGVGGPVLIAHGKSSARAVECALRAASQLASSGLVERLKEGIRAQHAEIKG